jgi:hypothetical protein
MFHGIPWIFRLLYKYSMTKLLKILEETLIIYFYLNLSFLNIISTVKGLLLKEIQHLNLCALTLLNLTLFLSQWHSGETAIIYYLLCIQPNVTLLCLQKFIVILRLCFDTNNCFCEEYINFNVLFVVPDLGNIKQYMSISSKWILLSHVNCKMYV